MASFILVVRTFSLLLSLASPLVHAQTFPDYPLSNTWLNLSPACITALNTTVQCSGLLALSAERNVPRLNAENLTAVCTASCLGSLNSARATIQAACTLSTDLLPLDWGTYPATYLVDIFKYAYSLNCRRDLSTNEYCDVLFLKWLNQPSGKLTDEQECSDCMLGVSQLQLNSPFGYDANFASSFTSLTSSCSKTGYSFTRPPPYVSATSTSAAASTTSTASATPTDTLDAACVRLYTIQANDTCNSIAVAQSVSTYAVYGPSGLRDCDQLPTGGKLCLLGQCTTYKVTLNDTCDSIIAAAGITVSPAMFVAWNPNINTLCTNLAYLIDSYICLSRPDGIPTPNMTLPGAGSLANATAWPSVAPTSEAQLPKALGTLTNCTAYQNHKDATILDSFYQPQFATTTNMANRCFYVAAKHEITVDQLLAWNPSLSSEPSNCTLAAGFSYCVRNGNSTYIPGPMDFCFTANSTLIPPSTTPSCSCYTQYSGYDAVWLNCNYFVDNLNITLANLQSWNPLLAGSPSTCDSALFTGLSGAQTRQLCVGVGSGSTTSSSSSRSSSSTSSSKSSSSSTTRTTTTTTTSSASTPTTSTPGSVCILGTDTGNPNQSGLCSFSCHYGYCPPGPCVCTAYGAQVQPPPNTGVAGYKLSWEDGSYIGLCSYVYDHGYYPTGACTTHADGSPQ